MLHGRRGGALRWRGPAIALLVLAGLLLSTVIAAGQDQPLTVKISGLETGDWPSGQVVATVLDADGRPVSGLDQQAFEVSLDGSSVPVTGVKQGVDDTLPISIVLVLDVSNSMRDGGAIDPAKDAARRFLQTLGPGDSVAVVTFDENVHVVQPFTTDKSIVDSAIAGLATGHTTALYQATAESVQLAASAGSGRRAIVLLSDGGLGTLTGTATKDEALATATGAGIPVFAIGLGTEIDRDYLSQLAQATGGRFAETPSPEGLDALYQEASELLRGQYILAIDGSSIESGEGSSLSLKLAVSAEAGAGADEREVCLQPLCVGLSAADGATISDAEEVTATVMSTDPVLAVALLVDGVAVQSLDNAPYTFEFDPKTLDSGAHTLAARVTTQTGEQVLGQVDIRTGSEGGMFSTSTVLLGALAIGGVIIVVVFVLFLRGRLRGGAPKPEGTPPPDQGPVFPIRRELRTVARDDAEAPPPTPGPEPATAGYVSVVTGGSMSGQSFPVGTKPLSIGTGHRCGVKLDDPDGLEIGAEHARIWIRDDHLMLHELRRLSSYGPAGGRWAILSPGESFSIGQFTFRFDLGSAPAAAPEAGQGPVPDILRSHDDPSNGSATPESGRRWPFHGLADFVRPGGEQAPPAPPIEKTDEPPDQSQDLPPAASQ